MLLQCLKMHHVILIIVLFSFPCYSQNHEYEDSDFLKTELELIDLEVLDIFENIANAEKVALQYNNYDEKIKQEEYLGHLLNKNAQNLKVHTDVPTELERNLTLYTKPGDGLLPEVDYSLLVKFHNENQRIKHSVKIPCVELVHGCPLTEKDYQNILAENRDQENLKLTWERWQRAFKETSEQYLEILPLINKAASMNDLASGSSYWETLLEFEDAYSKAETFWEEIKPLYMKLHNFVKVRLNNTYNLSEDSTIPVYLLGSNFGDDWSNLADIILPHRQIHFDATSYLKNKNIKHIYELSETMTKQMGLGSFGKKFWSKSQFNSTSCTPELFTYCSSSYAEVYDCNSTTWVKYLDAHEIALEYTMNNLDYYSYPQINLRVPVVNHIVRGMGSILAVEHLQHNKILESDNLKAMLTVNNTERMTQLLLVALRVLPRLPYYLAADRWRIDELQVPSLNISQSWWEMRKKYQGVSGVSNDEKDFLGDDYISSNTPYLGKFLGTIFSFQLLEQYRQKMADPTDNVAELFSKDNNLIELIKSRPTGDWPYLFTIQYGLYDWSTNALLDFFRPLESYLDTAPLYQADIVIKTTTTTTTTAKPKTEKRVTTRIKSVQADRPNDESAKEISVPSETVTKSVSNTSVYILVGVIIVLVISGGGFLLYKKIRRRPRTNNRRFET